MDGRMARIAEDIAQRYGVEDALARIAAGRGIDADSVDSYLVPALRDLMPDPATITDLLAGSKRLKQAVDAGESVAIFGDYDVDGAASCALLYRFLTRLGISSEIYIPDRIREGYGPNRAAIGELAARHDLIVCVDCGTNSADALGVARDANCDVVIIDHHQVGGALPEARAVINPNREDDLSGLGYLCAAGVVFMVLVDLVRQLRLAGQTELPDLLASLDLVALATVCDVVPLTGLNRAFVKKGLVVARRMDNAGMRALAHAARLAGPINAHHFGFLLGPRINAGGRIGDAALGARLLCTDDKSEATHIAEELDRLNRERQAAEAVMLEEAKALAEKESQSSNPPSIFVTASESWHPGIVGLLASRLKDAFQKPAFAIAIGTDGTGTGSARSISGLDVGKLVRAAVDEGLAIKGGGHAMAAGITIEVGKLPALRAYFESQCADAVRTLVDQQTVKIDAAITAGAINGDLLDLLEMAGPFGAGNASPIFVLPSHRILAVRPVGAGQHLRVNLASSQGATIDAMAFGATGSDLGQFLARNEKNVVHVAGTVSPNTWQGQKRAQLRIIDAAMIV